MKTVKLVVGVVFSVFLLSSCSKEKKAQQMAANYLKGVLFHFDSYKPLQTRVDSSFTSFGNDPEAIALFLDMCKSFGVVQKCVEEMDNAECTMEVYAPNRFYSDATTRGEYRRAKEKYETNQQRLERTTERIQSQFTQIKQRQSQIKEGIFDGWIVYHRFTSLNGAKTVDLPGEYVFFCDTEFNEKMVYSREEYETLSKIMETIAVSNDLDEFVENVQDLSYTMDRDWYSF